MGRPVVGLTAIVTGAGSGINFEFARLLLQKGANVVFADLTLRPEAQEVLDQYSGEGKVKAIFQKTNVAEWQQLQQAFDAATQQFGDIDIVCPGAGIYEPSWSNFWLPPGSPESKDDLFGSRYATMDINLTHPIRATQLAVAHFMSTSRKEESKQPKFVIHISSIAGQLPAFATPIYVATKYAINGFVRSLARLEPEHNIRVAAVAPGIIKTPLWTPDKVKVVTEADEWVMPEEVAEAMVSLIEQDEVVSAASNRAGTSIHVKGGTILEVSKGFVRDVMAINDPGPSGPGNTVTGTEKLEQDALRNLERPSWGIE